MSFRKRKPLLRKLINTLIIVIALTVAYFLYVVVYDLRVRLKNRSEISEIAALNENYANRFARFVEDIEKDTDWNVIIISGLRTKQEQVQLKRENPRNAAVNKSRHVLGRAVDLNLYKRQGFRFMLLKKSSSKASWSATKVPEIAKRNGLLWGGTYRNYHDPVHFEIN